MHRNVIKMRIQIVDIIEDKMSDETIAMRYIMECKL